MSGRHSACAPQQARAGWRRYATRCKRADAMSGGQRPQPISPRERIMALDVLRGFAMLGVLIAYCMWSLGTAPEKTFSRFDRTLEAIVSFAVDGKFYTILAFLFGLGFSIQLGRAPDDLTAVRIYRRRLAALAAIGLVHALLLRNGDILLPYALTGFLLIPFRRSREPVLLGAAFLILLFPYAAHAAWQATGIPIPNRPDLTGAPYLIENAAWVRYWYETAPFNWPTNLTLFLFGLYAGRHRLLARLAGETRKLTAIIVAGLLIGTAFYFLRTRMVGGQTGGPFLPIAIGLSYTFHCWGLSSAYAATLLLALRTRAGVTTLSPLAAVGRLALTNYLMQSGIIVPMCLAFGWFDHFTPSTSLLLAGALFALIQLPLSILWLRRFQFGPAEWLWRLMAYGRVAPLKLTSTDYASA